jgi:uncharacterized protein YrzB (UPF0473 family)
MLSELKIGQASSSKIITPISQQFFDSDSISSHNSTDSNIKILEENFGKINLEPKLQIFFDKSKLVNFAKNWYSRPTPPNLQFNERLLQPQFFVSADKLYEWNINGLNIEESGKENIFRILQNNDFSEFCCNKTKACSVLIKSEEQEDLLITLISKIENSELKEEYLNKLKKTMIKDANKPS